MKSQSGFDISFAFIAYVPPYHEEDQPYSLQTEILKKESKTTDYLLKIFDASMNDAKVEIMFNSDGKQNNEIRNNILAIAKKDKPAQKAVNARHLAQRLYLETDERNGTGLFAIIVGKKARTTRIVLLRFKGDEGLVNKGKKLLLDYMSEVFTKKSHHYKLVVYEDIVSDKSFWKGFSVDKQLSSSTYKPVSLFWVESFLDSKTALTSAQGTLQFSKVIKTILSKVTDVEEQEQIISGVVNLKSKGGIQMSIADFCKNYLTPSITDKIKDETSNDDFFNSVFTVDAEVYGKELGKTVLSLQNGITAYVPTFSYGKHVKEFSNNDGSKNIVIEGRLSGKKINVQQSVKKQTQKK